MWRTDLHSRVFDMTSEDWKTVLLAFIALLGTISSAVAGIYAEMLRRKAVRIEGKQDINDQKTDDAAKKAEEAANSSARTAKKVDETQKIVNGRMDELLKAARDAAFAEGKAAGIAEAKEKEKDKPS